MAQPTPQRAELFHTGSTCPFCQETVDQGQLIVLCPECGSVHHETCWNRKGRCSSYHCDEAVRTDVANASPDISIRPEDLVNVHVPPHPARPAPEAVARQYSPQPPEKTSRLAVVGAAGSVLSLAGLWGIWSGQSWWLLLGIALSLGSMITGVISLVMISSNKKTSGLRVAIGAVLGAAVILLVCLGVLWARHSRAPVQSRGELKMAENLPTEDYLAKLAPPVARALRSNVIIRFNPGAFGRHSYGSGVILNIRDRRAAILTNKHVIGGGRGGETTVTLFTGESSVAQIAWSAPEEVDAAILSCEVLSLQSFEPVPIADGLAAQGEKVFAVGNPMQLSWSYTEGTISGLRTSTVSGKFLDIYQTQTPLNPGNSGGGLYAADGRLLGLNTWTYDKATGEGLGFATALPSILKLMRETNAMHLLDGGKPGSAGERKAP